MKILLLAGEESGVLYADRIRGRLTGCDVRGYGDYGFDVADLAVMGIGQVLRRIFYFMRVKRTMERAIDEWKPDVVCTIDYPGMNLKLAAYAKSRGIRAVHVVCPQVWAWKRGRIPKIEASLDALCCFFPFEPSLFRPGFATFVGHPLVEEMGNEKAADGIGECAEKTLALLPGSRIGEIEKHLPVSLEVAAKLRGEMPGLKVVIPAANEKAYGKISSIVSRAASGGTRPAVAVTHGKAREALRNATCAVVASGTATLEAALARCPTVLVYRVGWLFAFLARRFIKGVRHIGLANVIWEKCETGLTEAPMPELLQEDFTVENVRSRLVPWLTDASARRSAVDRLDRTMSCLSSRGDAIGAIVSVIRNGRADMV